MKKLFYALTLFCFCLSIHSQDLDLKAVEDLKNSLKTISESELTDKEKDQKTKLMFSKAIGTVETAKSHYAQTYQFDKVKRAKEIMAQLKEGKTDIQPPKEEAKKEEIAKPKKPAVAPFLKDLFSEELLDKDGKPVSLSNLNGKVIGIYFSASWCGPCRGFTPELAKFRNENSDIFEVVLVGSDSSESAKNKYMNEFSMNWPSVKIDGKDSDNINGKFKSNGIPYLVILSKSGEVITTNGRSEISSDNIKKWAKEK